MHDKDSADVIAHLSEKVDRLERELEEQLDVENDIAALADFKEAVRARVGLHWDARDAEILARVKPV
jgi:hypothetical protein